MSWAQRVKTALWAGFCLLPNTSAHAAAGPIVTAVIDASRPAAPVTKYQYGMFIEPIRDLVARTLWAEMIEDRKFYYPVVAEAEDTLPATRGHPAARRWRPIGPSRAVSMDTADAYVGKQSVRLALAGDRPVGLRQSGVALRSGREYVGRLVINSATDVPLQVALRWGNSDDDGQVVKLHSRSGGWQTLDFQITPGADANDATFEVTATGRGSLKIGTVSLMPRDNVEGWRADTTAQLRTLNSGFWRLPGGNFLSNWDWHEAIGPRDKRPPMFDEAWSAVQSNDIGMDEWMTLTRLLAVEPYVTVDAGLGDANSAGEEVEYLNGAASTYWGGRRAANGHLAPYNVKLWNIGNEPYGPWQIGVTTLKYYVIKHRRFAARMLAADPSITLIASGAMPDQEKIDGQKRNLSPQDAEKMYGTDEDWTGALLAGASGTFQGITEHWYDAEEKRPSATPAEELIESTRQPSNHMRMKAVEWDHYRKAFPEIDRNKIFLSIDEYAATGTPNLKKTLAYAMVLNEMLRHTDFMKMSALTVGTSTLDITPHTSSLNAVGLLFQLYGQHLGAGVLPLQLNGNAPQPDPKYSVGYNHPKVNAGSATYPLDILAALSADRRKLIVSVVNPTFETQQINVRLKAIRPRGQGSLWRLEGNALDAVNKTGAPSQVRVTQLSTGRLGGTLRVVPTSTTIFEFPVDAR